MSIGRNLKLCEDSPDAVYVYGLDGRILDVNAVFEEVTGWNRADAVGRYVGELFTAEDRATVARMVSENGRGRRYQAAFRKRSGGRILCDIVTATVYEEKAPIAKQGFAREMGARNTERELVEKTSELAKFSRYLQLLHRLSTTNYFKLEDLFADYLATGAEIFGVTSGAITQQSGSLQTTRASFETSSADLYATKVAELGRTLICSKAADPSCPYAFYIGTPISVNEQLFGSVGFWGYSDPNDPLHPQSREIVELMAKSIGIAINQRNLTDLLAHQARHDALTGLPNRLLLRDSLDSALDNARQSGTMVAVVFIDLDRFKQINDTLGHSIGDGLLQQIAWRLEDCLDSGHRLARMGGDEFTAILGGLTTQEAAIETVRRMLAAVSKPCRVEGYELFVTASMGLSFFPKDGRDAATLLRNADTAMYAAKNKGKNGLFCFTAETSAAAMERLATENHLRRALEREELELFYQPQVELCGRIAGVEVLLVWDHPSLGRVSPSQFIPIAEESGLILPIGSWVLRQACRRMAEWQRAGYDLIPVSVNVSPLQFAEPNFVSVVADAIAESAANPNHLILEITESLLMQDVEQSARKMAELRSLGVKIAIDDFGTGYSSLSYLRRLPADCLKIDQSFLHEIEQDTGTLPLIQTIVVLAHNLGLAVTAEGVENEQQLALVRAAGCDRVQGHLFGPPLKANTVEKLFQQRSSLLSR